MTYNMVPYYTVTALVSTQKSQYCSFDVSLLLPCSTYTAILLEYLHRYSKVTVELLKRSSTTTSNHGWKKCGFSRESNQNFPPILLNFPPFLYLRGKISLQMSEFPRNQVPEFPIFSRHDLLCRYQTSAVTGYHIAVIEILYYVYTGFRHTRFSSFFQFKGALDNFSLIPNFFFKKVEIFIPLEVYTYVVTAC